MSHSPQIGERFIEVFELDFIVFVAYDELPRPLQVWPEVAAISRVGNQGHLRQVLLGLRRSVGEQVFNLNAQRASQHLHGVHRWVTSSTLNPAHVAAGESAPVGECLLRKTYCGAQFPDAGTEPLTNVDFFHIKNVTGCDIKGHSPKVDAPIDTFEGL